MWMVDELKEKNTMFLYDIIKKFENDTPSFHGSIHGNAEIDIDGVNLCNRDTEHTNIISYAASDKYVDIVKRAVSVKVLVINERDISAYKNILFQRNGTVIVTDNPETYFYALHEFLYDKTEFYHKFDFISQIGEKCKIAESAVIEKGVIIGNNVIIGANTVVKHGSVIEDDVIIGCNTIIGSEGFQVLVDSSNPPIHVTHVGGCYISKNVHIGDNTCICNSLFEGKTFIGENVKIDNLVYVAHNNYIGKNAVITAQVVLCGSTRVEEGAWIAPNSSIINRVTIGAYSKVGMGSVVTKDVEPNTVVFGNPARKHKKI